VFVESPKGARSRHFIEQTLHLVLQAYTSRVCKYYAVQASPDALSSTGNETRNQVASGQSAHQQVRILEIMLMRHLAHGWKTLASNAKACGTQIPATPTACTGRAIPSPPLPLLLSRPRQQAVYLPRHRGESSPCWFLFWSTPIHHNCHQKPFWVKSIPAIFIAFLYSLEAT
jgi:hypothetical protein